MVSCLGRAADISGAGATFPYPIYAQWAATYKAETGIGLNYQSIGSGGGIKQAIARTVIFGATDRPLKSEELEKHGLVQFPMVMGGVVPVINVPGIAPGALTLDGTTLADIYLGRIKRWNDPAISRLNPGLVLPSTGIIVLHRSDGSGTTFIFADYLAKSNPAWRDEVGVSTAVEWPIGLGAKGNEGIANYVMRAKGTIGYVEYVYAKQNKLAYTRLVNREGVAVSPTLSVFQAAAAGADWAARPGFDVVLTDQPGAGSWPIAGATFILLPRRPRDVAATREAIKFFAWAYRRGGNMAEALDYIPMPETVIALVESAWSRQVVDATGAPLYRGGS